MKKPVKTITIIGGGIAGLSAGIYAQKNGFESVILEKHSLAGGQCTGWNRQGYHIDGCIHWLSGTKADSDLNKLWHEVGALDGVEIIHPESFMCFEHNGQRAYIYRDLERLQQSWCELSPEDAAFIEEFCGDVRSLQSFSFPVDKPGDMMGLGEKIKMMLSMKEAGRILGKYGKMTLTEFAERFTHPALREGFASMAPEQYNAAMIFFAIAAFTTDEASIPTGGSRALAQRMVERYRNLGGRLETGCEIASLEVNGRQVTGVADRKGRHWHSDYFIAACDAHFVYHDLLQGRHNDPAFEKRFKQPDTYPLASEILVAIGFNGRIDELSEPLPWSVNYPIEPICVNGREIDRLTLKHFSHEPGFAPEGRTLLVYDINQFHDDYEAWAAMDTATYKAEKQRIGEEVIAATETRFPVMRGRLSLLDVATPRTYERYCNAYRGAFMAFFPSVKIKMMDHSGRIKGLDNLVLSGQWLQPPGGLPIALTSGRNAIMRLCQAQKKDFIHALSG